MAALGSYATKYETVRLERRDGILQATLHTGGDSLQWSFKAHEELPEAFHDIAGDAENKVVILTGVGREFIGPRVGAAGHPLFATRPPLEMLEKIIWEGKQCLMNFLDINVPVIAAVNGPVWRHAELPLLADIVLAAETACFEDSGHYHGGLVPGDGTHVVFPLLLGFNRARYFLLTGERIDAPRALELGLVGEVLPPDRLLARAWEHAERIATRPRSLLRFTRAVLTEHLKRHMNEYLGFGLHAEMLAILDRPDAPK
ncbi:MAG: enoyl-CoA hydratase/isomerase family protein [Alphaproteobacteria bacterium]|nr:enoyl-CoA hydratase/isomerase family protein [Alphaproteobacteria bacterium]